MTATIQKPDANPAVAALVSLFFDLGHVLSNGQQRKWMFTTIAVHVGFVLCCLPGIVLRILSVIDAYQTAQRLQAGEVLGENEYSYPLLFKVVRMLDATATCARM
jgi:hypothetical protein